MSASPAKSAAPLEGSQSQGRDQRKELRSSDYDLADLLGFLAKACSDTGWGSEKLSVLMECDQSYTSRVLRGEKPITLPFLYRLPDDVKESFASLYLESKGYLVVKPAPFESAMKHLLSGLFTVLSQPRMDVLKPKMAPGVLRPPVKAEKVG